ncbi:unnamed protein product [Calypogeia fissa]
MKHSQVFELKDMKKSLVKPYSKTQHPEIINPAVWDLLFIDSYIPVIFFYRPQPEDRQSFAQKVAHLKESLSKALVQHYPFAGRWIKTYDERVRELQCNDEGVTFFEALIDAEMDAVIGDVDDFRAVPTLGNFDLVGLTNLLFQHDVDFPLPPIFFQVTGFKCGGISLYGAFSHMATDGKGFFDFMAAWSQEAMHDKIAVPPVNDRSMTMSHSDFMDWMNGSLTDSQNSTSGVEVQIIQANGNSSKRHSFETEVNHGTSGVSNEMSGVLDRKHAPNGEAGAAPKTDPGAQLRFKVQIPVSPKTLLVRKEPIQDLKKQAVAENPEAYVTTVDCITSHIWLCLNSLQPAAEEFQQSRSRTSRPINQEGRPSVEFVLGTAVEARKRCHDPPLPGSYSGNCLFLFQTPRMAPSDLLSKSHLEAARIFHKTVREISPETWRNFLKTTMVGLEGFMDNEYRHILMTSWITFPMYSVEFRHGVGKPFFVGVNMEGGFLPEGYCVFLPPRPGSPAAANVQFGLQDDMLRALLSQKNFLSLFH